MFPFSQNQTLPYASLSCSFIPSFYQHFGYYFSFHQPFTYHYSTEDFQSASHQIAQSRSTESLINFKNFNFKNQVRKVHDGKFFSFVSNLNTANHLISYNDERNRTVYDIFKNSYKTFGNKNFLGWKPASQQSFKWMTYSDASAKVKQVGSALIKLGLRRGGFIGIFAKNRPEWVLTDLACVSYSFTSIPLYETFGPEAIPFILEQTEMTIVFCEDSTKAALLLNSKSKKLKILVVYENQIDSEVKKLAQKANVAILTFDHLRNIGKSHLVDAIPPKPEDIYTICYTSGTTGLPKGAILTHANMISTLTSASLLFKVIKPFNYL